ncbi:uncharacterized protein TNIN_90681 [Trichonephila inaurata madagascariensis]|uniref:Uncharacterized protein n=1 Tax=Trichonephila inaurata madagascariensis TaxID=2747483 RepID=A0A8X6WZZ6_9ARAC|nr:uncharacterized protein TNIN_90681 [Trichonephila inaurata madagascariensis]
MIFYNPTVPTLQQMSFAVIAVKICTDLEVMALTEKYGHTSFLIPSKEMHRFLNKELPQLLPGSPARKTYKLLIDDSKDIFCMHDSGSMYYSGISKFINDIDYNFIPDRTLIAHRFEDNNLPCMMWEELISKKISTLPLPQSMKSKLMPLMRCICVEIDQWKKHHEDIFQFHCIDFQRYFCWNTHGKIDRVKTAKSLINDESLSITERYNLARRYVFVSDVISLWEKLPPLFKIKVKRLHDDDAEKVWCQYLATRTDENLNRIIRISLYNPFNLRACFSVLKQDEKAKWLKDYILDKRIHYEDLCLCLSLLEKSQQELIFIECSSEILQYYLVWPLQNKFLDVLKSVSPYMSVYDYSDIFYFIVYERIMIGWKDFDYVRLLNEFWWQTPNTFNELLKDDEVYQKILPVISCELNNSFPNEVILENYQVDAFDFHYVGIKYRIHCCN